MHESDRATEHVRVQEETERSGETRAKQRGVWRMLPPFCVAGAADVCAWYGMLTHVMCCCMML